jgi:hypothetical protein
MAVKTGTFAFEEYRLDPANALLWRGDDRVALAPKPFEVLCRLVGRPRELVTKEELLGFLDARDRASLQNEVFGTTRERMLREFCELLQALSSDRPWALIIEDLHWSDYATLNALSLFARRQQKASVLLLATYRPGDVMMGGHPIRIVHQELQIHGRCTELALDRLSLAEVEQFTVR